MYCLVVVFQMWGTPKSPQKIKEKKEGNTMTTFNFDELNRKLFNVSVDLEDALDDATIALNDAEDYAMELFHSVTEKENNGTVTDADYKAMEDANDAERERATMRKPWKNF